jgi:predicted HicB family RNase H-like nuclease
MPRRKLYGDDETVAFSTRLPRTLKEHLQKRAQANRRSLNQEVVWLVEWALAHLPEEQEPDDEQKPV